MSNTILKMSGVYKIKLSQSDTTQILFLDFSKIYRK